MVRLILSAVLVLFLSLLSPSLGEVQLICPPVLTGNDYTELTPGPRTIIFRETNARRGSPFRLSIYRGNAECVFLDHIPYQPNSDTYYVTVDVPNLSCSRTSHNCRLVLRQIDTISNGYCQYPGTCNVYNSTTQISVRGSSTSCSGVRRKPASFYKWPYEPSRLYTSNLRSSTTAARGSGLFVLIDSIIIFNVTMTVPFSSPVRGDTLRFFYYPVAERLEVLGTVSINGGRSWNAGSWSGVSGKGKQLFRDGLMYVDIVTSSNDGVTGQILPSTNPAAADNRYGSEYGSYVNGWFTGLPFTGPGASAEVFATPMGACISNSRYFGCMLDTSINNAAGTVAASITGNRLVFSIDMHNIAAINNVNILGIATDTLELASYWSNGNRVSGILDISDEQLSRLLAGLSTVDISTSNGKLTCDLEEGIISMLSSGLETPPVTTPTNGSATAFFSISVSGDVYLQVTLNGLTSALLNAHLHGPAPLGIGTSSIPYDMSSDIRGRNGSSWNIYTILKNVSASSLRYFKESLFYLNMHTEANPSGELRGQTSIIGDWICPSSGALTNQCKYVPFALSSSAAGDYDNRNVKPSGIGAAVIGRLGRLQYSVSLMNIDSDNVQLIITSPNGALLTTDNVQNSPNRANVKEFTGYYPIAYDATLTDTELSFAQQGRLGFTVTTPTYPRGIMLGSIPSLEPSGCGQDTYTIRVGGANGWTQGQSYQPIRLLRGDSLSFEFNSPDTVFLMENKNRYDGCVFSTATLLSSTSGTYRYTPSSPGNYYFASNSSCQAQRPMKFPVYVVDTTVQSMDSSTCSESLYSYTADQRYTSDGDTAGVVAAAVSGFIVGAILVVTVIVIVVITIVRRGKSESSDLPAKA